MHSHGTKLFVKWDGTNEEQIAKCRVLSGPETEWKEVDDSHLDMANPVMESSPGLEKPGKLALECIFSKAQFDLFLTAARQRIPYEWRLQLPDTSASAGFAWIAKLSKESKMDDNIMVKADLQITGQWTFTPAP